VRWVFLFVGWASVVGAANPPDQPPAWSIRVDWPQSELIGLAEPPNPDSLSAPEITMLRNDYADRGGFPLGGISLKATYQLLEGAGHVSVGVIDLPAHFQNEGHVSQLGTPAVYAELHDVPRRKVQILENYAYYQGANGKYLCRSFLTGKVDTLKVNGTSLGYSQDRSHALFVKGGSLHGLTFSYYDISNPPAPSLLWSKEFPDALSAWQSTSLSTRGELVAIQYLDGILKLVVFDAKGEVKLRHTHGPDERATFGLEFISPNELLEGFDPRANYQETAGLSLYRIR